VAEHIPAPASSSLPGEDHLPFVGDQDALLDQVEAFLAGVDAGPRARARAGHLARHPGRLALGRARARPGRPAPRGRAPPRPAGAAAAAEAVLFFDGTVRALRCALDLVRGAAGHAAAGVHTGECDLVGHEIGGTAVEAARAVARLAPAGSVLASATTFDLVAGSGLAFGEAGEATLEGRPRQLYSVEAR